MKKSSLTPELIKARQSASVLIGIDPGVHTGIAGRYVAADKFSFIETKSIWQAINFLQNGWLLDDETFVRIEDARLRTWFGETSRERLKGAGSVERDCKIWEEVLTDLKIPHEFVHPKNVKATTPQLFQKLTGWTGRTSIHAREAAYLIM